ncbi:MAG: cystathionine beta-lyase [Gammaproteobacteria bacterium]|jgi:cystathionine beta-lyase
MTTAIDFDLETDRIHSDSAKWQRYGEDIIPLWVADSDFRSAPAIIEALKDRVDHGVFGYAQPSGQLAELIVERMQQLYQWQIEPEWLLWFPGVVSAMNVIVRSLSTEQEAILYPEVIYPYIAKAAQNSGRPYRSVALSALDERPVMDLERLSRESTPQDRLMILCNPYNPGGTISSKSELQALADYAEKNDLLICSDEIHCDLLLEHGKEHIPIAALNKEIEARTVTLMAPSKTFNIAGLGCSFAIVPDQDFRAAINQNRAGIIPHVNLMGFTAAMAAYRDGDEWNHRQCDYLRGNRDFLVEQINAIKGLSMSSPEATYLAWMNVSELKLDNPTQFFESAGVGMSPGTDFGSKDHMRLNFACTRSRLEEAIRRIKLAVESG